MLREEVGVLVVDDVQAMRTQIRDIVKESGFKKVRVAASGEEAKIALSAEPVHLVLADWKMEPLDGLGLLKFVRNHPSLKDVAFIMVTAETTKERVIEAIQSRCAVFRFGAMTCEEVEKPLRSIAARESCRVDDEVWCGKKVFLTWDG